MKDGERGQSRIATEYEPVQPTYAQTSARSASGSRPAAGSRIKKPSLDDMGPGTDRPVPARAPHVDPRAKAGAFGEGVRGPHKPTLDEMGPHASLPVPVAGDAPRPPKPARTIEVPTEKEKRGRRGRSRKTGRPGQ
jgi:excinuclease ABC subunit B